MHTRTEKITVPGGTKQSLGLYEEDSRVGSVAVMGGTRFYATCSKCRAKTHAYRHISDAMVALEKHRETRHR